MMRIYAIFGPPLNHAYPRIYICARIFSVAAFLDVHASLAPTHVSPSVRKLVGDTFEFLFSISVSGCSTRTQLFFLLQFCVWGESPEIGQGGRGGGIQFSEKNRYNYFGILSLTFSVFLQLSQFFFHFLSLSPTFSVFPQLSPFFLNFLSFSSTFSVFPQLSQIFLNFFSFSFTFSVLPQLSQYFLQLSYFLVDFFSFSLTLSVFLLLQFS